jgi:hypothetical protein
LLGVIGAYVLWAELIVQTFNKRPLGNVTSGLPYPFLNDLELPQRMVFYASNIATAILLLLTYAGLAWLVRRRFPAPVTP